MSILERLCLALDVLISGKEDIVEKRVLLDDLMATDQVPEELACAVLLVDLALIDQEFDAEEYDFVQKFLARHYKLTGDQITDIIKQASNQIANLRSSYTFASQLRDRLPIDVRQKLVKELTALMKADGHCDNFEKYLVKKMEDLLIAEAS